MGNFKQNLENQRERFVKVFNDTLDYIKENSKLSRSVEDSRIYSTYYFLVIHDIFPHQYQLHSLKFHIRNSNLRSL